MAYACSSSANDPKKRQSAKGNIHATTSFTVEERLKSNLSDGMKLTTKIYERETPYEGGRSWVLTNYDDRTQLRPSTKESNHHIDLALTRRHD